MRILLVHNHYQHTAGEDAVVAAEASLLRQNGHKLVKYTDDNSRINGMNRAALAARAVWSRPTHDRLTEVLRDIQFDIVHFHNTFPLISPSAYSACREAKVPIVQTLHNYRLLCPAATLFRNGQICETCLGKTPPWPAVWHACYRESRSQTAIVAAMLTVHRWLKTWNEQVDIYIVLSEFCRRKFIEGGLPSEKIYVKPNFLNPDPGLRKSSGHYSLFVGRLSPEKGVWTLLRAWQGLKEIPLKIAGDGGLMNQVKAFVHTNDLQAVEILGQQPPNNILLLMQKARFLILPSEWYETFGLVAIEAFACGVPVIASRLGAMAEIVEDGHTGVLFRAGDSQDLAEKIRWAMEHPNDMHRMGKAARRVYEEKYTAKKNYTMLLDIYKLAVEGYLSAETKPVVLRRGSEVA
jgi:glycosyltransferase involved in cell wall biosynthesis